MKISDRVLISRALSVLLGIGLSSSAWAITSVGPASVWDSGVALDTPAGIYPVGGSGQVNGSFVLDTVSIDPFFVQVGLRAQERFVGPVEPTLEEGRYVYDVEAGESGPGLATWNFDLHLDFGYGRDTQLNMADFIVTLFVDSDPSPGLALTPISINFADPILLAQSSLNLGFMFGSFDPNATGIYDFGLGVALPQTLAPVAQVMMRVRVNPAASVPDSGLTAAALAMSMLGLAALRRRLRS